MKLMDVLASVSIALLALIFGTYRNRDDVPQQFTLYVAVLGVVMYVWPVCRALLKKTPTKLALAITAILTLGSTLFGPRALSFSSTSESFFFSLPLACFAILPNRLPKFIPILGVVVCLLVILLQSSWGTPREIHAVIKLLVFIVLAPLIIWYVANRRRVWSDA
ncbi:MAG TPA: hypothetical protein VN577_05195 [Terriglobales bacterium]|nr:hypothetical protein [Terriglobales bacterium]